MARKDHRFWLSSRRFMLIAILVVIATFCSACETLAPLISARVEIRGPEYAYGEWRWDVSQIKKRFTCNYVLIAETFGPKDGKGRIEWAGGVSIARAKDGRVLFQESLTRGEIAKLFGSYMHYRDRRTTYSLFVAADEEPFDWTLRVAYYDTYTGYEGETEFNSRCVGPEGAE